MSEKKAYTPPKIFEVELNQDQAILTACSAGVTAISSNTLKKCLAGTCKRATLAQGGDSANHPS